MKEVITLKNGLKFVILSKFEYEENKYLYLSSYDDCDEIQIVFAKVYDNKKIEPIEDGELIVKLMETVNYKMKNNND